MGTVVMMYVLPMLLGQTYDLGKEKPGLQIYPISVQNNATKIQHYFTDSQYRMVENAAQVKDFLDISGKLSLKIKGGMVDVSGEGSYLKDSAHKSSGIEILVKVHFETETWTIPSSLKPNADWGLLNEKFLGTHYCRSITYGGDLIASVRITASNTYDLMRIKAAINGGINAKGGSFNANVKGKLDLLKQNAQDSSSMEINYYATVPIHGVSYTVDGLLKLVEDFPSHVKKVNKGLGNPLRMELYPISSLKEGYPFYLENRALTDQLDDLEDQFDDLRETRRQIGIWVSGLPPVVTSDVDSKIKKFTDKVNSIFAVYMETIENLDVSKGASTKPIQDAFDSYQDGEYLMPQKYVRAFLKLQQDIYKEQPELKPRIGGAQYIRWGVDSCGSEGAVASVVGVAATSEIIQNGGSSELLCVHPDPHEVDPKDYFPGYPGDDDEYDHLMLSPIRYVGTLKKFQGMQSKRIACAKCRVGPRTSVLVHLASKTCPSDKWTKEYGGVLMAPGQRSTKGEFVCVDAGMKQPTGKVQFGNDDESHLADVQEVSVQCGSLPCGPYAADKPIPCVVCSI